MERSDPLAYYQVEKDQLCLEEIFKAADYCDNLIHLFRQSFEALSSIVQQINSLENSERLNKAFAHGAYLQNAYEAKWPVFHFYDESFEREFSNVCSQENKEKQNELLLRMTDAYCNGEYWDGRKTVWRKSKIVGPARLAIFEEAITLHKFGYYYGATALLSCQIYGVANEVSAYIRRHGLELTKRRKTHLAEKRGIKPNDIDKEKGRLLQSTSFLTSGAFIWYYMYRYLSEEILCSSDRKERWNTQPLRNKICHGEQTNFGTKEHSLKALLTIDLLMSFSREAELKVAQEKTELGNSPASTNADQ